MNLMNKFEKKFGRYAIPDLINYFLIIYIAASVLGLFAPNFYYNYLMLDFDMVRRGQIWRIVTFIMEPYPLTGFFNILFFVFSINLYYLFGRSLESAWGAFRFNLYFFSGILLSVLAALIYYLATGMPYPTGLNYIYQSMFFAFAVLFPDTQFMIYMLIPIKVKYLAWIDAILLAVNLIQYMAAHYYVYAIAMIVAMLNFFIFFYLYKDLKRFSPKQTRRRKEFHRAVKAQPGVTRHKCAICGRTEITNPELEFRFCSKCEGNYEYCSEHLFTHEHVKRH